MKKLFLMAIASIAFWAMINGCHKNPAHCEGGTYYIDGYTRSLFFSTDTDSYWVYQDSLGHIDSSWASALDSTNISTNISTSCTEAYLWNIQSSILENNYQISGSNSGTNTYAGISYRYNIPGWNQQINIAISNGSVDSLYNNSSASPTGYHTTFYSTYQVNQYTFNNAVKITSTYYGGANGYYFVLVPNIGIVEKWNYYGGTGGPLKLVRYFIKH
jgi:hypothetical protein